ncbi:MAG TPA: NINE protein [Bacilli bacterium]|nr:NINE protein [Bacilli bacterium]
MAKIIKINDDIVLIGTNDSRIKEVRKDDINFDFKVGDEVEVYETENHLIVSKVEKELTNKAESGININVSNNNNPASPMYIANNTKAVNKVVYCLLAFFLGGIGIHKFYAGKTSAGILYILFCWTTVPMIISIIDLIIALCKKPDSIGNILI